MTKLRPVSIVKPTEEEIASSDNSTKEQDRFFSNRETRDDKMHGLLHWLIMVSIVIGYALIVFVGGVWLYHFIAPNEYPRWLNNDKLEAIRWFITGVFGSHVLSDFVKKKIQFDK